LLANPRGKSCKRLRSLAVSAGLFALARTALCACAGDDAVVNDGRPLAAYYQADDTDPSQ
jgi:hypothetical protein